MSFINIEESVNKINNKDVAKLNSKFGKNYNNINLASLPSKKITPTNNKVIDFKNVKKIVFNEKSSSKNTFNISNNKLSIFNKFKYSPDNTINNNNVINNNDNIYIDSKRTKDIEITNESKKKINNNIKYCLNNKNNNASIIKSLKNFNNNSNNIIKNDVLDEDTNKNNVKQEYDINLSESKLLINNNSKNITKNNNGNNFNKPFKIISPKSNNNSIALKPSCLGSLTNSSLSNNLLNINDNKIRSSLNIYSNDKADDDKIINKIKLLNKDLSSINIKSKANLLTSNGKNIELLKINDKNLKKTRNSDQNTNSNNFNKTLTFVKYNKPLKELVQGNNKILKNLETKNLNKDYQLNKKSELINSKNKTLESDKNNINTIEKNKIFSVEEPNFIKSNTDKFKQSLNKFFNNKNNKHYTKIVEYNLDSENTCKDTEKSCTNTYFNSNRNTSSDVLKDKVRIVSNISNISNTSNQVSKSNYTNNISRNESSNKSENFIINSFTVANKDNFSSLICDFNLKDKKNLILNSNNCNKHYSNQNHNLVNDKKLDNNIKLLSNNLGDINIIHNISQNINQQININIQQTNSSNNNNVENKDTNSRVNYNDKLKNNNNVTRCSTKENTIFSKLNCNKDLKKISSKSNIVVNLNYNKDKNTNNKNTKELSTRSKCTSINSNNILNKADIDDITSYSNRPDSIIKLDNNNNTSNTLILSNLKKINTLNPRSTFSKTNVINANINNNNINIESPSKQNNNFYSSKEEVKPSPIMNPLYINTHEDGFFKNLTNINLNSNENNISEKDKSSKLQNIFNKIKKVNCNIGNIYDSSSSNCVNNNIIYVGNNIIKNLKNNSNSSNILVTEDVNNSFKKSNNNVSNNNNNSISEKYILNSLEISKSGNNDKNKLSFVNKKSDTGSLLSEESLFNSNFINILIF